MTSVCASPAVYTAHVKRHGSVSATRAGWAACATRVSVIKLRRRFCVCLCVSTFLTSADMEVRVSHTAFRDSEGCNQMRSW